MSGPSNFGKQILAVLKESKGPVDIETVVEELRNSDPIVRKGVEKLVKDGHVTQNEDGTIQATGDGEKAAEGVVVEKKASVSRNHYELLQTPEKGPKQMLGICEALKALGGSADHDTFMDEIPKHIETRQQAARVFQFYRARLVEGNYVKITAKEEAAAA